MPLAELRAVRYGLPAASSSAWGVQPSPGKGREGAAQFAGGNAVPRERIVTNGGSMKAQNEIYCYQISSFFLDIRHEETHEVRLSKWSTQFAKNHIRSRGVKI